jgi:hypothetical protein
MSNKKYTEVLVITVGKEQYVFQRDATDVTEFLAA